jgi:Fe2+ transport protein
VTEGRPPLRKSEESTARQLRLAVAQGDALQRALEAMDEESDSGVLTALAGDYEIGIAVEEAEGMWHRRDGELAWADPGGDENCHVEVCVRDAADGRFVPGLEVHVTLLGADGDELGTARQPFLWHPWLHHYGRNWRVPGAGRYRIRVRVEPPVFMRHDHENGRRYLDPVAVEFDRVAIEPGRKPVGQSDSG